MLAYCVVSKLSSFCCFKLFTTGGFQDCAAHLNDIRYVLGLEFNYLVGYKAAIAAVDAFYLETAEYCRAGYRTNCGVHSGSVAPEVRIPIVLIAGIYIIINKMNKRHGAKILNRSVICNK